MTKEQIKTEQTGRSMVEMLGVLAVIGVLSVTGVAGYQRAMTKHRANEILNEASKRAVIVASQIAGGKSGSALSIAEFNNTLDYGTIAIDTSITGNQFGFTISGVEKSVCDQMVATAGTDSKNPEITCGEGTSTATLKYNSDLGEGTSGGGSSGYDDNAGAKACTEATAASDCDVSQTCTNGKCVSLCEAGKYYIKEGDSGYTCASVPTTGCECPSSNGICVEKVCASGFNFGGDCVDNLMDYNTLGTPVCPAQADTKGCNSNADCDTPNEYCSITGSDCSTIKTGTCLPVGTPNIVDKEEEETGYAYNGFRYSSNPMSWWSAENWCKAQRMHLVYLSDLGCTTSDCPGKWAELQGAFGSYWCWTENSYSSCGAYVVDTPTEYVLYSNRNGGNFALCRE